MGSEIVDDIAVSDQAAASSIRVTIASSSDQWRKIPR